MTTLETCSGRAGRRDLFRHFDPEKQLQLGSDMEGSPAAAAGEARWWGGGSGGLPGAQPPSSSEPPS